MTGGVYLVCSNRNYRGHQAGATFQACLDPNAERRAIARGDIRLIERITPSLQPGSFHLPPGWVNQQQEVQP